MKLTRESVSALAETVKRREFDEELWSLLEVLLLELVTILTLLEGKGVDLERFAHTLPGYRRRRKARPEARDSSPSSPESTSDADPAAEREPRRRKGHGRQKVSDFKPSETVL